MKLSYLKNTKEYRKIRDVVMSSGSTVNIFEPTLEEIDEILKLQDEWVSDEGMNISGADVVKVLFPMLTDLEGIDEMTESDVQEVIDNPSNAFIQIQYHIETIITEVYKTAILKARKEILEKDLEVENYKVSEEVFDRTLSLAAKNNGTKEVFDKLQEAEEEFKQAEENEKITKLEDYKNQEKESESTLDEAQIKLAQFKEAFADKDGLLDTTPEKED
mgnify:FL=1